MLLRYHIVRTPVAFDAAVFDAGQRELARQRVQTVTVGPVEVDLSARNLVVEGDFYGASIHLQGSQSEGSASFGPLIGRDRTRPDERSWITKPGGVWKTWKQEDIDGRFGLGDGDFAIVACVRGPL
jgi:hypothetical protein